jgi:hypothetical protein
VWFKRLCKPSPWERVTNKFDDEKLIFQSSRSRESSKVHIMSMANVAPISPPYIYISPFHYFFKHIFRKVAWGTNIYWYLKTLNLKFQKNRTKIEVVWGQRLFSSALHSQSANFGGSQAKLGKDLTASYLIAKFWNFWLRTYKYWQIFRLHATIRGAWR